MLVALDKPKGFHSHDESFFFLLDHFMFILIPIKLKYSLLVVLAQGRTQVVPLHQKLLNASNRFHRFLLSMSEQQM